jgi:cell division protein FtsL
MTRLNLILYFALMLSALGLVNAQHKSRKLYIELEQMSQAAKQYEQEFGQLQLEQSTWAMHSRVESIAAHALQMQVPDAKRIQVVSPNDLTVKPAQMPQANVKPTGQVVPQSGASQ